MNAILLGMGTQLPRWSVSQETSAAMSAPLCCESEDEHRLFRALYRRSRVRSRHSVLLNTTGNTTEHRSHDKHHNDLNKHNGNGNGHATGSEVAVQLDATVSIEQTFFPSRDSTTDHGPGTRDRMARYAREAVPLALGACRRALNDASVDAATIDHLITVSCTGFAAPGVDVALIQELGLTPQVTRSNVGFMGCHGAFNGLRLASALVAGGGKPQRALVCAVELCSLHFAYGWDPQRIVANALFADGAAAVVLESPAMPALHSHETLTPVTDARWQLQASGSMLLPDSTDAMSWTITDHGFEMTLSPRVPELIETHLRGWLTAWLAQFNLTIDTIGSWAVHPGGPRILQSVQTALGLPAKALEASHQVLDECGNMSSPTILFILERLRQREAPRPCVALGFGPGLSIEAMLL